MAILIYDRVLETTAVVGTGDATLLGPTQDYISFAAVFCRLAPNV